uniref:tRNA wybutosine-synthesizing protein 2 homolog n=1 Tax=Cyprinus carpio carpio TaxID=630221 RepID=A0A8C1I2X8_CYPCA
YDWACCISSPPQKYLLSQGVLDRKYCAQKHSDGTVTPPVVASVPEKLDLVALMKHVTRNIFCEIVDIQVKCKGETWSKDLERDIPSRWILLSCNVERFWWVLMNLRPSLVKRIAQMKKHLPGWLSHTYSDSALRRQQLYNTQYEFDVAKCMFCSGNITEKLRIASFDCSGETVVDLYAGIGYFTLPYLVHAKAAHVHACEWKPEAVEALQRNLQISGVTHCCTLPLSDLADRVNLVACRLLKRDTGGILHIHQNVTTPLHHEPPKHSSAIDVEKGICALLLDITGSKWKTNIKHIEHVKTYAPHISHVVLEKKNNNV